MAHRPRNRGSMALGSLSGVRGKGCLSASLFRYTSFAYRIQLQQAQAVRRFVTELAVVTAKNSTTRRTL